MILFVRHGQTNCNVQKILQGQLDEALNSKGIEQSEETAEKLKSEKIDVIYCSPLIRARLTADIINKYHDVEIIEDERLLEQNAGDATGRQEDTITKEEFDDFMADPHKYNAESFQDLYDRNIDFFKEIENSDKNILIVSHSGVWKMLYRYVNGLSIDVKVEPIGNGEVKILKE